jgi:uncharacterized protein
VVDLPTSDLHKPLGAPGPAKPSRARPRWLAYAVAGVPFVILAFAIGQVALFGNAESARSRAVAEIAVPPAAGPNRFTFSARDAAQTEPPAPQPPAGESTATQLEDESGVRVLRPSGSAAPNAVVIRVPEQGGVRLAPAPDRRLVERSRYGALPRVGEDGARASRVYARPLPPEAAAAPVRIAILVGGLGISASATSDAIGRLPGEISFAFAPYGNDLEKLVQRARNDGHEVFLQVPMEPFDYPDNDPGPHTLTTSAAPPENIERLRWVLARFPGYVGVVNFMGGRLMSHEAALGPLLREAAERGLMVVDDGSSGRSVMMDVARGFRAPALKADLVLDTQARPEAIDRELARLEKLAREKGFALATAAALPVTIERLNRWSRNLEQRGIRLVPVSSLGLGPQTTGSIR